MTGTLDYSHRSNHLKWREGLSDALRERLLTPPEAGRDAYHGEARVWMNIHEGLLGASGRLPEWTRGLFETRDSEKLRQSAAGALGLGQQLVQHAHGHHHIEDDFFFPAFLKHFPELQAPLELLDGDHKVLSKVLDDLEDAIKKLHRAMIEDRSFSRDSMMQRAEDLLNAAQALDRFFTRHIRDEEEICLPVLYRL